MKIKQSFCYPIFTEKSSSDSDLFAFAKEVGYEATEFWGPPEGFREIVASAHSAGLKVASFTGHDSIEKGFNDPSQHDRIIGELEASILLAAELDIPGIIVFAGSRNGAQSDLEGLVIAAEGLRKIVPFAAEHKVCLNLEILNSRTNHAGYMGDTVEWGVALCEMVRSPYLKILFDIYHVAIMQGDVIRRLRRYMSYIGHIHTAGNPGRHELDDSQELNYRAICSAIAESGYEGYVGHEFFPAREGKRESLQQAFGVCSV